MYFKAFNVLPADVKNKIHFRQKAFGSNKMRHGFHNAVIGVEGVLYKFFAVAGNGSGKYFAVGVFFVKSGQVIAHGDNGVAFVALVKKSSSLPSGATTAIFMVVLPLSMPR